RFCKTLVYRTLIYSVIREIADIETNSNALDGHVECSPSRLQIDRQDLNILISKLKHENVLSSQTSQKKQTTKQYETKLRDLIVLGSQDHDINLIDYLKYEYYDVPPALSDNFQLLNPSNNNKVIEYFMENYPQQFAFTQSNDE
ncbi:unnamed protein product, partial [Didymodactylos carnosus]